jgi:nucleoside-diphosphate-sugar epimerase
VRALLERGYRVRALTRNPQSERAQKLAAEGVEVVKGDLGDPASLRPAVAGVDGVLSVTDFWEHGHDKEIAHGKNLADAAQAAGVKHFVFSSVGGADRAREGRPVPRSPPCTGGSRPTATTPTSPASAAATPSSPPSTPTSSAPGQTTRRGPPSNRL